MLSIDMEINTENAHVESASDKVTSQHKQTVSENWAT